MVEKTTPELVNSTPLVNTAPSVVLPTNTLPDESILIRSVEPPALNAKYLSLVFERILAISVPSS